MPAYEATYNVPTMSRATDDDGVENLDNPLCTILENNQTYRFTATNDKHAHLISHEQLRELTTRQENLWPSRNLPPPTLLEIVEKTSRQLS